MSNPTSALDRGTIPPEVWEKVFLGNLISHTPRKGILAYTICKVLEQDRSQPDSFCNRLEFPLGGPNVGAVDGTKYTRCIFSFGEPNQAAEDDWKFLSKEFPPRITKVNFSTFYIGPRHKNLMNFCDAIGLSVPAKQLLTYIYLQQAGVLPSYFHKIAMGVQEELLPEFFGRVLNDPENIKEYREALKRTSSLAMYGIIEFSDGAPVLNQKLLALMGDEEVSPDQIISKILGKPGHTDLTISDFQHFADVLPTIIKAIQVAREKGEKGINILLYGPAGSGKTELAKAIAKAAGMKIYSVAEEEQADLFSGGGSDDQLELSTAKAANQLGTDMAHDSSRRMTELLRVHALLAGNREAMALFDEIEDLLPKGSETSDPHNKVMLNRLLEGNDVPTIWCGNDLEKFHPSVRQRFTFSLRVGFQPAYARHKIWTTQKRLKGVDLSDHNLRQLARTYNIPPRIVAFAVDAFRRTGEIDDIHRTIAEAARVTYGSPLAVKTDFQVPMGFNPSMLCIDSRPLDKLIERSRARRPWSLHLCTAGDMGEEEFCYYAAEEGYLDPYVISAKDLLLGQSTPEDNLQRQIESAGTSNTLLVIRNIAQLASNYGSRPYIGLDWENPVVDRFCDVMCRHEKPWVLIDNGDAALPGNIAGLMVDSVGFSPLTSDGFAECWDLFFEPEKPPQQKSGEWLFGDFTRAKRLLDITGEGAPMKFLTRARQIRESGNAAPFGFDPRVRHLTR